MQPAQTHASPAGRRSRHEHAHLYTQFGCWLRAAQHIRQPCLHVRAGGCASGACDPQYQQNQPLPNQGITLTYSARLWEHSDSGWQQPRGSGACSTEAGCSAHTRQWQHSWGDAPTHRGMPGTTHLKPRGLGTAAIQPAAAVIALPVSWAAVTARTGQHGFSGVLPPISLQPASNPSATMLVPGSNATQGPAACRLCPVQGFAPKHSGSCVVCGDAALPPLCPTLVGRNLTNLLS